MDGQPTRGGLAARAPEVWQGFFAFLGRPVLPERVQGVGFSGLGSVARLFALDLLLMTLLLGGIAGLAALGIELPQHALEQLALGPELLVFILIGAPVAEEILFRGWLSGRPGHVFALLALIAGGAIAFVAAKSLAAPESGFAALAVVALAAAGAVLSLWFGRRRTAWPWFQRRFRWFYFASALAFAGIHLFNFGQGASAATLPLVLPQFVLGLILGYIRVIHGLWASVLLHALHNAVFIGIVLAAS